MPSTGFDFMSLVILVVVALICACCFWGGRASERKRVDQEVAKYKMAICMALSDPRTTQYMAAALQGVIRSDGFQQIVESHANNPLTREQGIPHTWDTQEDQQSWSARQSF